MRTAHRIAAQHKRHLAGMGGVRLLLRTMPYTAQELVALKLPIRSAYDEMRAGRGTQQHWADLAVAINTTLIRAEAIDQLMEQAAITARNALLRMRERYERTGRWGFDGPAIAEVEVGIDLHEQLLDLSTPQQMMDAGNEAHRREAIQIREQSL